MIEKEFEEINQMIQEAQNRAYQSVNRELIELYWRVGEYVSKMLSSGKWKGKTVQNLADFIQNRHSGINGFSRRGLFRMKKFFETYK